MNNFIKILKSISLFSLSGFLPQISNFLLLPITTKFLRTEDFSIYGIILAYNLLLQGIKGIGLDFLFVNSFFKQRADWKIYWSKLLGLRLCWKQIFFILQFLFLYVVLDESKVPEKITAILFLALSDYFFSPSNDAANRYYVLSKKSKLFFIMTSASVFASFISNYFLIVKFGFGWLGWIISSFLFSLVSFLFNAKILYIDLKILPSLKFDRNFVKRTLRVSLPLIPHHYSTFLLHSSDRIIMDRVNVNLNDIGNYNIAYMLINALEKIYDSIGFVIMPIVNELYVKNDLNSEKKIRKIFNFAQLLFFGSALFFSSINKELFNFFFNDLINPNIPIIASVMVVGISIRPMYWATVNKLMFYEKSNIVWRISAVSGLTNVVLNIIFIPKYGYIAAMIATNICFLFQGIIGFYLKDYKKISPINYQNNIWLIWAIILSFLSYGLQFFSLTIRLIFMIFVLVATTYVGIKFFRK